MPNIKCNQPIKINLHNDEDHKGKQAKYFKE